MFAAVMRSRIHLTPRSGWGRKLHGVITDIEDGLATIVAGGWRIAMPAISLSLLITAIVMLRLGLLLDAFDMDASSHQLVMLLLTGLLVGSMPIPGADAWATGQLLRVVRLLGPGAAGFTLLSSVIATLAPPVLAAGVLLWWALPRSRVSLRCGELAALIRQPPGEQRAIVHRPPAPGSG
jgi:hypothetical protein